MTCPAQLLLRCYVLGDVRPAGKSRGRGIRLFNDVEALIRYVRGEEAQGLEARWIAQKYVERPLIIQGRKFDIRQ
jgi:tubulin monoglycylase TTLL3/8